MGLEAELFGHQVDGLGVHALVDADHHADLHTGGDDLGDGHVHHGGQFVGRHELRQLEHLALSLLLLQLLLHALTHGFALLATVLGAGAELLVLAGETGERLAHLLGYLLFADFCNLRLVLLTFLRLALGLILRLVVLLAGILGAILSGHLGDVHAFALADAGALAALGGLSLLALFVLLLLGLLLGTGALVERIQVDVALHRESLRLRCGGLHLVDAVLFRQCHLLVAHRMGHFLFGGLCLRFRFGSFCNGCFHGCCGLCGGFGLLGGSLNGLLLHFGRFHRLFFGHGGSHFLNGFLRLGRGLLVEVDLAHNLEGRLPSLHRGGLASGGFGGGFGRTGLFAGLLLGGAGLLLLLQHQVGLILQHAVGLELLEQFLVLFVGNLGVEILLNVREALLLKKLHSGLQSDVAFLDGFIQSDTHSAVSSSSNSDASTRMISSTVSSSKSIFLMR